MLIHRGLVNYYIGSHICVVIFVTEGLCTLNSANSCHACGNKNLTNKKFRGHGPLVEPPLTINIFWLSLL